jgi:alternate signal-mediated exported protein
MKKNKKKKLVAAACLALLAAGAGTFAWINSQDQRINRVKTAAIKDGSVSVEEVWNPKPIVPGTDATKEVAVTNSGNTPVFVRVSYEEVLNYLTEKGAVTNRTEGWKANGTPALSDDVPVEFDGDKYTDAGSGYTDVTAKVKDGQDKALAAGVKVYAKGSVTKDPVTGDENTTFSYSAFFEYSAGKFQAMTTDVSVKDGNTVGSSAADWKFVMNKAEYSVYKGGYSNQVTNWAASTLEGASAEATAAKASLLGSVGKKYDVDYDYTAKTLGIAAIPAAAPATTAGQIPTAVSDKKGVQADTNALGISGINIEYGTDMIDTAALAKDKWTYNKEDGYFYYTSPVNSGATTPHLLKKLVFTNAIGTEYTNATYDLIVKMEAIQATKEALTDTAGWNLQGADGSDTKKINVYLEGQAAS